MCASHVAGQMSSPLPTGIQCSIITTATRATAKIGGPLANHEAVWPASWGRGMGDVWSAPGGHVFLIVSRPASSAAAGARRRCPFVDGMTSARACRDWED